MCNRPPSSRRGVTLIELMITIMIISILAAAVLGVAAVAGETAREAKTRNIVARLHTLLMEHYGTFASRRIKFRATSATYGDGIEKQIDDEYEATPGLPGYAPQNATLRNIARSEARLYAMRELLLMEVPDRWSDVYLADLGASQPGNPYYYGQRTELSNLYLRRYRQLRTTHSVAELKENESAECLYMVIMLATGDGEARTLFGESNIGDTDKDGAPEFLDGWGHPISFRRWAPGFESDVQQNVYRFGNPPPANPYTDSAWLAAANADHDPFDLFRVDKIAFRLMPLIFSNGRDEKPGIEARSDLVWAPNLSTAMGLASSVPLIRSPQLTPYLLAIPGPYAGTDDGTKTATDNIHNHLIGTK